jgi:DNA-binding transcriptional LysR family regulator
MEIRWMRTFVAVAEELNFGRAARRLGVAQPAVTQQINVLEKELKVKLFHRTTRSVKLTDAGEALHQPAKEILLAVETAVRTARNAGSGQYGHIRLGFNGAFTSVPLSGLVRSAHGEFPNIQLEIDSSRRNTEILTRVESGELDLGLVGGPLGGRSVKSLPLEPVNICAILPTVHPLAATQLTVAQLSQERFILPVEGEGLTIRSVILDACSASGFHPKEIITASDGLTVLTLVEAGMGVGFSTTGSARLKAAGLVTLPVDDSASIPTHLVWNPNRESPAVESILGLARISGQAQQPA